MNIVGNELPHGSLELPRLEEEAPARPGGCALARLCRAEQQLHLHQTVAGLDRERWNQLAGSQPLLRYEALEALEPGQSCRYVTFWRSGQLIGVARYRAAEFVGPAFETLLTKTSWWMVLARWLGLASQPLHTRIAVCGSALISTLPGFAFRSDVLPEESSRLLAVAGRRIQQQLGAAGDLCEAPSSLQTGPLADHGYTRIGSEPAMTLALDPAWSNFDDYLASLASKYRVKARRAYAKSRELTVRRLSARDLRAEGADLRRLYKAVVSRARFRLGNFDTDRLPALQDALGDALIVQGSYLDGRLVGFLTGVVAGPAIAAGIVGFDPRLNRAHSIYPRMLYDYVRLALARGSRRVDFGRTAAEIKSTVGARPFDTFSWARHRNLLVNRALPALARRLELPSQPQRLPFKKSWYAADRGQLRPSLGNALSA